MHNRAKKLMAAAFMTEPDEIEDAAALGTQRGWDSLGHMRLVVAIEEALGKTLDPYEVVAIHSLGDVARLLSSTVQENRVANVERGADQ